MTLTDYIALSPLLVLLATGLLLLLVETFVKNGKVIFSWITTIGLFIGLYAALYSPASSHVLLTSWLKFDTLSTFFTVLFMSIGIFITAISTRIEASKAEYYFLLIASIFGLILISSANDYLTLFLGLETLSISLYVLCSYMKEWGISHEAAFKYFLLGSISSALLLFGIALLYGATGTTRFDMAASTNTLFMCGIALVTTSLLFKAAIWPFHIWAPDVYAGAPTPVTAFMAVATKAGAFSALIRLFMHFSPIWHDAIGLLAYPTLIYANFVAMKQVELRRFFAYSGIAHAGFLLIPLASSGPDALSSMLFYIVVYSIATLTAFCSLAIIPDKKEGITLNDIRGLFSSSPLVATVFVLSLLTLAGIPPTVGFFAKFYVFKVAYEAGYYGLIVIGLLTSVLAAYYYLRIVAVVFSQQQERSEKRTVPYPALLACTILTIALVALSFYPEPILNIVS